MIKGESHILGPDASEAFSRMGSACKLLARCQLHVLLVHDSRFRASSDNLMQRGPFYHVLPWSAKVAKINNFQPTCAFRTMAENNPTEPPKRQVCQSGEFPYKTQVWKARFRLQKATAAYFSFVNGKLESLNGLDCTHATIPLNSDDACTGNQQV